MTTILLNGKGVNLEHYFDNPLSGNMELALQSLSMYYSWPNITDANNKLVYISGGTLKTVIIPEGAYGMTDLARIIKNELHRLGDEGAFKLGANYNTLKAVIDVVKEGYVVKMGDSSIRSILGWKIGDLDKGTHISDDKVNITSVNEILVHCSAIEGIYAPDNTTNKLSQSTVLTSFYPNVAPGYKFNLEKTKLFYQKVNVNPLQWIRVWLTDQNYNPIDNKDEQLTIKIHLRSNK